LRKKAASSRERSAAVRGLTGDASVGPSHADTNRVALLDVRARALHADVSHVLEAGEEHPPGAGQHEVRAARAPPLRGGDALRGGRAELLHRASLTRPDGLEHRDGVAIDGDPAGESDLVGLVFPLRSRR
jgi:hypothetical protein